MKKILISLSLLTSINLLALEISEIDKNIIKECKEKLRIEEAKLEKEFEKIDMKGCYIVNNDDYKNCEEYYKANPNPEPKFILKEDLIGYSDSSLRCKLNINGKEIKLEETLWMIDMYGI